MDKYKFELIRASEAEEITHSVSVKFEALTATELLEAFVDFARGCGFYGISITTAMERFLDDYTVPSTED
jgi:hypothetical protein